MLYSTTKYDHNHEAIMTTLFYTTGFETRVLIATSGWKNHDQMVELWRNHV